MTLNKAWIFIFIGVMLLMAAVTLVLASLHAEGVAYSVALVLVLCVGGFFNFLAVKRYGAAEHGHR